MYKLKQHSGNLNQINSDKLWINYRPTLLLFISLKMLIK